MQRRPDPLSKQDNLFVSSYLQSCLKRSLLVPYAISCAFYLFIRAPRT